MSNYKKINPITDNDISTNGVVSLAIRPNQPQANSQYGIGGLSGKDLQRKFDNLARLAIARCNMLVQLLSGEYRASTSSEDKHSILEYILTIKSEESGLSEDLSLSDVFEKILTASGELKVIDPAEHETPTYAGLNDILKKIWGEIKSLEQYLDGLESSSASTLEIKYGDENLLTFILKNTYGNAIHTLTTDFLQTHNTSADAHSDIRGELTLFKEQVNNLLDSDEETLDELHEIVAYIQNNKSLIDAITISKVSVEDIQDSLYVSDTDKPLSANKGKELREMIESIEGGALASINLRNGDSEGSIEQKTATAAGKNSSAFGVSDATYDEANKIKTEVRVTRGYDPNLNDVIIKPYGSEGAGSGSTGDLSPEEQPDANSVMEYRDKNRIYSTFDIEFDSTGAIGENSFTSGDNTLAAAKNSKATGWKTYAGANYATAEGSYNIAVGEDSHSEGLKNASIGQATHTEGMRNTAEGKNSHIEGLKNHTSTNAVNSHVEGSYNNCRSSNTHIEGMWNYSVGSASHSHVEGTENNTNAPDSHAEGSYNSISGSYKATVDGTEKTFYSQNAHVEGSGNTIKTITETQTAKNSHAEGHSNTITAENSHAEGEGNSVQGKNSHAEGMNNFIGAFASQAHVEGADNRVEGDNAHAEGYNTRAIGKHSHAEGSNVNADGSVRKTRTVTLSDGSSFSVEGSTAQGMSSHAEGVQSIAYGFTSHAEGYRTLAEGDVTHAEGSETQSLGAYAHAEGRLSKATGERSHAEGTSTIASGYSSHAGGESTIAARKSQHVIGQFNIEDTYSDKSNSVPSKCKGKYIHIVGNGTSTARSNAHTVDWSGNAWFSGKVRVGGTSYDEGADLVNETQVKTALDAPVRVDVNIKVTGTTVGEGVYWKIAFSYYSTKAATYTRNTINGLANDLRVAYKDGFLIPVTVCEHTEISAVPLRTYSGVMFTVLSNATLLLHLTYVRIYTEHIDLNDKRIYSSREQVVNVELTDSSNECAIEAHARKLSEYTGNPFT